jgi:hypothetical protein
MENGSLRQAQCKNGKWLASTSLRVKMENSEWKIVRMGFYCPGLKAGANKIKL